MKKFITTCFFITLSNYALSANLMNQYDIDIAKKVVQSNPVLMQEIVNKYSVEDYGKCIATSVNLSVAQSNKWLAEGVEFNMLWQMIIASNDYFKMNSMAKRVPEQLFEDSIKRYGNIMKRDNSVVQEWAQYCSRKYLSLKQ